MLDFLYNRKSSRMDRKRYKMNITDGIKRISFHIDSYEFPYHEHNTYEDNNWLNVYVEWEDDVVMENGITPSLLTSELKQLWEGCSKALVGVSYKSNFLEPELHISLEPKEEVIQVICSYEKPGRTRFSVECTITKAVLDEYVSKLHEMCLSFPERKNTMLN